MATVVCLAGHTQGHGTYTVTGALDDPNSDGKTIYIKSVDTGMAIDSTIITDQRFFFTGNVDTAKFCRIDIGYNVYAHFILENGNITVDLKNHNAPSGTPLNDAMRAIDAESSKKTHNKEDIQQLLKHGDELLARHGNDALGYYMLLCSNHFKLRTDADMERVINHLGPWLKSINMVRDCILPRIEAKKATAVGKMFADIDGWDAKGNPKALSDYIGRGNYVLMDMWASWCAPCKEEIPYLAMLHEKYGKSGLTVLGLFVWDSFEELPDAIETNNVTWPQIVDINNVAAKTYGVAGIPHIILFAPDGKIIARDLRGQQMIDTVEKLMDKGEQK